MEKLNCQEVKSISKQSNAITFKSPTFIYDIALFLCVAIVVAFSLVLIISENARRAFFVFSFFPIMGIVLIVLIIKTKKRMPPISLVFYDGKMIFHTQDGVYYSITPSELQDYNISAMPTLFKYQNQLYGLLNLNCEFGSFGSLYVFKINKLKYYLDAFKEDKDVLELVPYTPTFVEEIYKYLIAMLLSFAFMFGFGLCFSTPYPWNIVALIAFPLIGLVSSIYFLSKILKIRKKHKK
ncbi:MAG: hypothetical protein HDT29_03065 [Clostridiales bacterium]|nr:hypothetical protein [Clostridiales bacterium]